MISPWIRWVKRPLAWLWERRPVIRRNIQKAAVKKSMAEVKFLIRRHELLQLPIYIILGPSSVGKQHVITEAEPFAVEFQHQLAGVQWVFSEQAIYCVVDTDWRHDAVLWSAFWQQLAHCYRQCQGLVLVDSMTLVAGLDNWLVAAEVQRYLQLQLPVYFMLAKADELLGFDEFFSELSEPALQERVGYEVNAHLNSIGVQQAAQAFKIFSAELKSRCDERLLHESNSVVRSRTYFFLDQLSAFHDQLIALYQQVSESRYMLSSLWLKQVCWVSAKQAPATVDLLAADLGLESDFTPVGMNHSRPCFIRGSLAEMNKARLASPNKRRYVCQHLWHLVVYGLCVLVVGWLCYGIINAYQLNKIRVSQLSAQLRLDKPYFEYVPSNIDARTEQISQLGELLVYFSPEMNSWKTDFGLSAASKVQPAVEKLFSLYARSDLVPILRSILHYQLTQEKGSDLYQALAVYLMLNDSHRANNAFIEAWFNRHWQNLSRLSNITIYGPYQENLRRSLHAYLILSDRNIGADPDVVARARAKLLQLSRYQLADQSYRLVHQPTRSSVLNLPSIFSDVFDMKSIQSLNLVRYTRKNFNVIYPHIAQDYLQSLQQSHWVLGVQAPLKGSIKFKQEVQQRYLIHYSQAWSQFVHEIQLKKFGSLSQLSHALTLLKGESSPVQLLIRTVQYNTHFDAFLNAGRQFAESDAMPWAPPTYKYLLYQQGKLTPTGKQFMAVVNHLQQYIGVITEANDQDHAAFLAVKAEFSHPAVIKDLIFQDQKLPAPLSRWLTNAVHQAWWLSLQSAKNYINMQWQEKVYLPFKNKLKTRYPFNLATTHEASYADMVALFGSKGAYNLFYQHYLTAFIKSDKLRRVDGKTLPMTNAFLMNLQEIKQFQQLLFPAGGGEVALKLLSRSARVQAATVSVNGHTYRPSTQQFISIPYPKVGANQAARASLRGYDGVSHYLQASGPWALFAVLQASYPVQTGNDQSYRARFQLGGHSAVYQVLVLPNQHLNIFRVLHLQLVNTI